MRLRLLLLSLVCLPTVVLAHVPLLPQFTSYDDIVTIEEPSVSQAFYAELSGFPHRYQFVVAQEGELFIEVLVPDIPEADDNIGGIIVRETGEGLFEEVTRLEPTAAEWESFYEPFGGDSYRRGPSYRAEVAAGEYLVEISNATNLGKYTFVVGQLEDFSSVSFLETMKRIYEVKRFYGKSPIAVFQSPFYFIPLIVVLIIAGGVWYWRRKKHA